MIALSVFAIAMAITLTEFSGALIRTADVDRATLDSGTARLAVDVFVADLRQASTQDPAVPPVAAISATTITFYSPDKLTPKHLRRISYQLTTGTLQRSSVTSTNTGGPTWIFPGGTPAWITVAGGVTNTDVFAGFDGLGVATTTAASVRSVNVKLDIASKVSKQREAIHRSGITIRVKP